MVSRKDRERLFGSQRAPEPAPADGSTAPAPQAVKQAAVCSKGKGVGKRVIPDRLPNGSNYNVTYDAAAEKWSGVLTVGPKDGVPQVFNAEARAVFTLLDKLDKRYRRWLDGQGGKVVDAAPAAE
jgi:hypothetical protein